MPMSVLAPGQLQYALAALLMLTGLYGMLAKTNLARKLMAMNVMQVAVIVFFIALAVRSDGSPPIEIEHADIDADMFSPEARLDPSRRERVADHHPTRTEISESAVDARLPGLLRLDRQLRIGKASILQRGQHIENDATLEGNLAF